MSQTVSPSPSLWRHPDFLRLWAGQSISELGSTITRDALPLLAVLTLNATTVQMGFLGALGGLPVLVFGILAGVWVDRLRRKPVMMIADLGRAILLGLIPLCAVLGVLRIELLYVLIVLAGLLGVFFDTAYQAYLPTLVERGQLVEGNSKLALSSSVAEIGGSGLAGVLVQMAGAPAAILLDALSFLASAGSLALIRQPEPAPVRREAQDSVLKEAADGLKAVSERPELRAMFGAAATLNFLGSMIGPLYSLYAIRVLGLSPAALGLTIALGGVSSFLGALLAEPALRRFGLGRVLSGVLVLYSLTTLLIPLGAFFPGRGLLFLAASQLFGDALRTVYGIHSVSLRQAITPEHLLGRVNASLELVSKGLAPIGALVGGVLGAVLGVQGTLFVAALNGVLAGLWILFSPVVRMKVLPQ